MKVHYRTVTLDGKLGATYVALGITESVFYKPLPRKIAVPTVFFQLSNKKL